MDPPEHLQIVKAQERAKGRNKTAEPHPGASLGTGSTAQLTESSKNTIVYFSMWQKWPLEQKLPLLQFL